MIFIQHQIFLSRPFKNVLVVYLHILEGSQILCSRMYLTNIAGDFPCDYSAMVFNLVFISSYNNSRLGIHAIRFLGAENFLFACHLRVQGTDPH